MRYSTRRSVPPPNPFLRTNRRVRTRGGSSNRSTRSTQELVSLRERQLQELWGEALNKEEVERSVLGAVMDDILQRAMEEAIPEIVVEARGELEQAVQERAAVILEEVTLATAAATASTPVAETVSEPREGAFAPPGDDSVTRSSSPGSRTMPVEASVAEEPLVVPEVSQVETHSSEISVPEGDPIQTDPAQSVEGSVVVSDIGPSPGTSAVVQLQVESITGLVQVHQTEEEEESTDSSDWSDRLVQGDIAPELSVKVQKNLKRQGVFLVIVTHLMDQMYTTQLVDGTLTIKEQRDVRSKKGEILITRDPDAYRTASMNLDVEWLQHQIRMRDEGPSRPQRAETSNVAVRDSDMVEVQVARRRRR